jgi:hypothetical protein
MKKLTIKLIKQEETPGAIVFYYSVLEQSEELRRTNRLTYILNSLELQENTKFAILSNARPWVGIHTFPNRIEFYIRGYVDCDDERTHHFSSNLFIRVFTKSAYFEIKRYLMANDIEFKLVTNLFNTHNIVSKF